MVVTTAKQCWMGIFDTVQDTTTVTRVVGVELEGNEAKFGAPGGGDLYPHVDEQWELYRYLHHPGGERSGWTVEAPVSIEVDPWLSKTFVVSVAVHGMLSAEQWTRWW